MPIGVENQVKIFVGGSYRNRTYQPISEREFSKLRPHLAAQLPIILGIRDIRNRQCLEQYLRKCLGTYQGSPNLYQIHRIYT